MGVTLCLGGLLLASSASAGSGQVAGPYEALAVDDLETSCIAWDGKKKPSVVCIFYDVDVAGPMYYALFISKKKTRRLNLGGVGTQSLRRKLAQLNKSLMKKGFLKLNARFDSASKGRVALAGGFTVGEVDSSLTVARGRTVIHRTDLRHPARTWPSDDPDAKTHPFETVEATVYAMGTTHVMVAVHFTVSEENPVGATFRLVPLVVPGAADLAYYRHQLPVPAPVETNCHRRVTCPSNYDYIWPLLERFCQGKWTVQQSHALRKLVDLGRVGRDDVAALYNAYGALYGFEFKKRATLNDFYYRTPGKQSWLPKACRRLFKRYSGNADVPKAYGTMRRHVGRVYRSMP